LNQLACVYFEKPDDFVQALHNQELISVFNKYRCAVFFANENVKWEESLMASAKDSSKLKFLILTSVFKVHECIVPYLIRKEPITGGSLTKQEVALTLAEMKDRPPIVEAPQTIWPKDIDMWYNFPETWSEALLPHIPETCFYKFTSDV